MQIELVIRSMFLITSRDLAPRMGYLPPLRNLRIMQHGNLEAPVGTVGAWDAWLSSQGRAQGFSVVLL